MRMRMLKRERGRCFMQWALVANVRVVIILFV